MDAIESAYVQGRLSDETAVYILPFFIHSSLKKKSLVDQFKSGIKAASGIVSDEQFFKESVFIFTSILVISLMENIV